MTRQLRGVALALLLLAAFAPPAAGAGSGEPGQGVSLGELRHLGEHLAGTLRRGQLDDALLQRLRSALAGHDLPGFRLAVEQAIDDFDFDRALTLLGELRSWLDNRLEESCA